MISAPPWTCCVGVVVRRCKTLLRPVCKRDVRAKITLVSDDARLCLAREWPPGDRGASTVTLGVGRRWGGSAVSHHILAERRPEARYAAAALYSCTSTSCQAPGLNAG